MDKVGCDSLAVFLLVVSDLSCVLVSVIVLLAF